jgi:nitroreductase
MSNTIEDIKTRRAIRKYQAKMPTEAELKTVMDAATWAPTGAGSQCPVIVLVKDKAVYDKLEKLNADVIGGKVGAHPFYGAPCVAVVLVDKTAPTPVYDGSLVLGTMMLAAHAVGLGSCWIHRAKETFETAEGKALLRQWGLDPEKYIGVGNCILGYAAEEGKAAPRKKDYVKVI